MRWAPEGRSPRARGGLSHAHHREPFCALGGPRIRCAAPGAGRHRGSRPGAPGGLRGQGRGTLRVLPSRAGSRLLPGRGCPGGAAGLGAVPGLGSAVSPGTPRPANRRVLARGRCRPYTGLLPTGATPFPLPWGFGRYRGPGRGTGRERRGGRLVQPRGSRELPAAQCPGDMRHLPGMLPWRVPETTGMGTATGRRRGRGAGGVNHPCLRLTRLPGRCDRGR